MSKRNLRLTACVVVAVSDMDAVLLTTLLLVDDVLVVVVVLVLVVLERCSYVLPLDGFWLMNLFKQFI